MTMGFKKMGFGGFGARAAGGTAPAQGAVGAAAATQATTDTQAAVAGGNVSSEQPPPVNEPWNEQSATPQAATQATAAAVSPAQASAPTTTATAQAFAPEQSMTQASVSEPSTALATQAQGPSGASLVRWEVGGLAIDLAELGIDVSRPLSALNDNGAMEHLGFALPLVKVEYLKTQEAIDAGRVEGQWTNMTTGAQKKTLDVVLVLMSYQRIFQAAYDPDAKEQAPPICRSLDGIHGLGSQEVGIREGQTCATCKYAKWTTKRDEKGKERRTQPCGDTFALLLHEADWGPLVWFVRRTGIPPFRKFNGAFGAKVLQIRGARLREGYEDVPVVNLLGRFELGTQKTPTHYLPVFGAVEATGDERIVEIAQALPLYVAIRERLKSMDIDLPADEEPEEPGGGQGASQGAESSGGGGWSGRSVESSAQQSQPGGTAAGQPRLAGSAFSRRGQ